MKSLFVSVCENITILLFDLLQMTYFYHKITKTSEALLSRMNESLSGMNACLCDFVMVFRQWAGRASTWKEISFQKEILAIGRKKEGNENFKEIGRKFDGEMRNLKTM